MAKKTIEKKNSRELRIKSCTTCNGNPTPEPYKLPDFEGTKCTSCWEILSFTPLGKPQPKPKRVTKKKEEIKEEKQLPVFTVDVIYKQEENLIML